MANRTERKLKRYLELNEKSRKKEEPHKECKGFVTKPGKSGTPLFR